MTYEEMRHLIAYLKRMIAQMESFLDEAEKKLPKEFRRHRDDGAWM